MAGMGANVIEIEAKDLRSLKKILLEKSGVLSAAQLGVRLRVLVDKGITDPIGWLMSIVGNQGHAESVRPSLEDVFVTCTGGARDVVC